MANKAAKVWKCYKKKTLFNYNYIDQNRLNTYNFANNARNDR